MWFIGEVIVGQQYGKCDGEGGSSTALAILAAGVGCHVQQPIDEEKSVTPRTSSAFALQQMTVTGRRVHSQRKRDREARYSITVIAD